VSKKRTKSKVVKPKEPKQSQHELALISERSKKFNASATKEDCINDLRNIQNVNPLKFIGRNFYRCNGKYSDATWNQFFGTFLEFRRQSGLELNRHQHKLEKDIAKVASLDIYKEFYSREVLPYHNKYELDSKSQRFKSILVGSDFHDLECDPFVLAVFIDTAKRVQPDVIVLNGDVFDMYEASRYDQDVRQIKILDRFNYVKRHIFGALRRACPNSQIDLVIGNHEWRILTLLANKTPALKVILSDVMGLTLSDIFGLDEFEINLIAKLDLAAFTAGDINSELKENFKVYYDAFVCSHFKDLSLGLSGTSGHTHRPELVSFANIPMGKLTWTTTGCISQTRMEYIQGQDKWTNSFLLAHIDTHKKHVSPEHFIVPRDFVVIHGVRYERKKEEKGSE
jgi:hypothetical protein